MRFGIREILFVLVLLAMPAAAYFFVFQPKNALQMQARSEIQVKQAKLQSLDNAMAQHTDLDSEIDRLRSTIELIEQKLPHGREEYQVVKNISDLALSHNLVVRSIKPDKVVAAAQYMELPVRLEIEGDFDGFYAFLLEVERLPRITQMPMMTLNKLESAEEEGMMEATITLSIFFESD
ncbi:MAG: type 4a pilus biogenesis protein PilO [Planctomycetota bacterium]